MLLVRSGVTTNCIAPGVVSGDDGEAVLDAEWASAAAPAANIMMAACASSRTTFGGLIAMVNLLNFPVHIATATVNGLDFAVFKQL